MSKITKSIVAGFVAVVALAAVAGPVQASDNYGSTGYRSVTVYRTVTTYVTQQVAYTVTVTRYDSYGHAYTVQETRYRTVSVPVTRSVPVTSYARY